jgi:hypothetical protein
MAADDAQRQQLIRTAMTSRVGEASDIAVQLWRPLSTQLISIIGEGGFKSLYDRSLYLTRAAFPWLGAADSSSSVDGLLSELNVNLASSNADEAEKASRMLIQTFTSLLASLIGERLTIDILASAWGGPAAGTDIAGKEFPHEQ